MGIRLNDFPIEILLNIFKFLSPRDVCTSAFVCKLWKSIANNQFVWDNIVRFNPTAIRRGDPNVPKMKSDILRMALEKRHKIISYITSNYLNNVRNRYCVSFRNLRLCILIAIYDSKQKLLLKRYFKLPELIENCDTEVSFTFPSQDMNIDWQSTYLEIFLVVPLFPQTLLETSKSPRQYLLLKCIKYQEFTKNCNCAEKALSRHVIFHECVSQCLLGIWKSDLTPAFLAFTFLVSDILSCVTKLMCPNHGYLDLNCAPTCIYKKERYYVKTHLYQPMLSPKLLKEDVKVMIVFTNTQKRMLCFNTWRAVELEDGRLELLLPEEKKQHVIFDKPLPTKLEIGSLQEKLINLVVVKMMIETQDNALIWKISQPVFLTRSKIRNGNFDCDGIEYSFEVSDNIASVSGLIIQDESSEEDGQFELPLSLVKLTVLLKS